MTNHMSKVAKILGVELNEEFRIEGVRTDYTYKISEKGLVLHCQGRDWWEEMPNTLVQLLTGEARKIIKPPRKPAIGDMYYYPDPASPILWGTCSWRDDVVDNYKFQHGLIFATREDAIAVAEKMVNSLPKRG